MKPNSKLSLQSHEKRQELWQVVQGKGLVTNGDNKIEIKYGDSHFIPKGSIHRMENIGIEDLVFIEVQTGESFSEEDIRRYQDDYGRAEKEIK